MNTHEKVVFLDIDGVLQPYGSHGRFDNLKTIPQLQEELTAKYGVDYTKHDKYDIGAVYYDWDKHAVALLTRILHETGAKIVISSDWRINGLKRVIDFFRLHGLHEYVIDLTREYRESSGLRNKYKDITHNSRTMEILEYVKDHPHIKRYVAIDDMDLSKGLEGHFVLTSNTMKDAEAEKAIAILNGTAEDA